MEASGGDPKRRRAGGHGGQAGMDVNSLVAMEEVAMDTDSQVTMAMGPRHEEVTMDDDAEKEEVTSLSGAASTTALSGALSLSEVASSSGGPRALAKRSTTSRRTHPPGSSA